MTSTTTPGHRPADPAATWWLAVGIFVIGLVLGVLITGLLSAGPTPLPGGPGAASIALPVPTTSIGAGPSGSPQTNDISVNDACLRAVNAAQDAYLAMTDIGEAAEQRNATRLDEIVRQLQPLQASLQNNIADCHITIHSSEGAVSGAASPQTPPTSIPLTTTTPTG